MVKIICPKSTPSSYQFKCNDRSVVSSNWADLGDCMQRSNPNPAALSKPSQLFSGCYSSLFEYSIYRDGLHKMNARLTSLPRKHTQGYMVSVFDKEATICGRGQILPLFPSEPLWWVELCCLNRVYMCNKAELLSVCLCLCICLWVSDCSFCCECMCPYGWVWLCLCDWLVLLISIYLLPTSFYRAKSMKAAMVDVY